MPSVDTLPKDNTSDGPKAVVGSVLSGAALGLLLSFPAILAAVFSGGAGHGDYVTARALFPVAMLLALLEGKIGALSIGVALLQFPIYGGLLSWTVCRQIYLAAIMVGSLHLIAAVVCFAGAFPDFS